MLQAGFCKGWPMLRSAVLLGLAVPTLAGAATIALDGPACFSRKDNRGLKFEVIQQAPPPNLAGENYQFYPLTGAASARLNALKNVAPDYALYYFQWGNRANNPVVNAKGRLIYRKANLQQSADLPRQQRSYFTSVARANACTLAQTAHAFGRRDAAKIYAEASGIVLVNEAQAPDSGAVGPDDTCVLANIAAPPKLAGVMLDYEVQDQRSEAQTSDFLREYAAFVHSTGHKALLMTNPLDAPSQIFTGFTAQNSHAIVTAFDRTTIWLWSKNKQQDILASYQAQKAMIEAGGRFDGSRILIEFELANTSVKDARLVHDLILRDSLAGVLLWRNGVGQGGACDTPVNAKIAALVFGKGQ
jgi:hypothetical protein